MKKLFLILSFSLSMSSAFASGATELQASWSNGCEKREEGIWVIDSIKIEAENFTLSSQRYSDSDCTKVIYPYSDLESWSYQILKSSETNVELKLFDPVRTTNNISFPRGGATGTMLISFGADGNATFSWVSYSFLINNQVITLDYDSIKETSPPFTLKKQQ